MPEIAIAVNNKIPSSTVRQIVCDNSDYTIRFTFDGQWEDGPKTVYFVLQGVGALAPAVTDGDVCTVPPIRLSDGVSRQLAVGVQQGQVKTSAVVNFWCYPSAEDALIRGIVEDEDVSLTWLEWVNANMAQAAENVRTAQEVLAEAQTAAESASENAESAAENAESAAIDAAEARISAQNAEASARSASASAEGIEAYVRAAEAAKTAAQTAAASASASAGSAQTAKTEAQTAKTEAETAKTEAETAKTDAQTAKTAAETARTGAETAQSAAEAAAASAGEASALIAQIAAPPVKASASGNPLILTDAAGGRRFASVRIPFDPAQDLHGYDAPWPAGSGKNKLDPSVYSDFLLENGKFRGTASQIMKVPYKIPHDLVGSLVTFSAYLDATNSGALTYARCEAYVSGEAILGQKINNGSAGYSSVTFTPTSENDYVRLGYGSYGSESYTFCDIQLESGSAATAYSPYSNICPVSGWTGANIHVSPTADPADGRTYSVEFPSDAGTVYGGTLDLTAGTLTVDRAYISLTGAASEPWTKAGSGDGTYFRMVIGALGSVVDDSGISSHFAAAEIAGGTTVVGQRIFNSSAYGAVLMIRPEDAADATVATFKAWLAEQAAANTPVQVCWKLTEPAVYPLTPVEIMALEGINTIWADCGPVSVEYILDTGAAIEAANASTRAMIGEASGVTASRSLAVGEYVTVGAALYRVTAAVGQGETLVPGTNVVETTVGAELVRLAGMINQ